MAVTTRKFGVLESGKEVTLYRITNASGAYVSIIDYGATIVEICVPDKNGKLTDVLLGCDDVHAYEHTSGYLGALIGRYGNRIGKGRFPLDGKTIQLECNDGNNHLHGGFKGFNFFSWDAEIVDGGVCFSRVSPDGEGNYPGTLNVKCTYTFDDDCALTLHYEASTDKLTACNLTNHSYFNLEGEGAGPVTDHVFEFNCDTFTVVDEKCIPTGEQRDVTGTPFDLRQPTRLADGLAQEETDEQLRFGKGFDHNFNINDPEAGLRFAVHVEAPVSGRTMDVFTDMPAVQFYCGNMLEGVNPGACGRLYHKREGFCLETQYAPDSIHHPEFPDSVLRAGEKYDYLTIFSFDVAE